MDERLTLTEAAAFIGLGQSRISQLMKQEKITFEREQGGRVFIRRSECERFKNERENPPVKIVERKVVAA